MNKLGFLTSPPISRRDDLADFAAKFDHTNLKPTSGKSEIERLCNEASEYGFAAVCIAPRWVTTAAEFLSGHGVGSVRVCTVVGFPHGNITTEGKVFETVQAIAGGASEIDMVISIGDLRDGDKSYVEHDIAAVVEAAHSRQAIVKVILETAYLNNDEIVVGCRYAVGAGADFVKTGTGFVKPDAGFGSGDADAEVVRLMRKTVGVGVGVKAASGITTPGDAQAMLDAGASRLGCTRSVKIMRELTNVAVG